MIPYYLHLHYFLTYVSKLKMVNILHYFYYENLACAPNMNVRFLTPVEISSNADCV